MKFLARHNKSYGTREEFEMRRARYTEVSKFIAEVNHQDSVHTHTAGHNKFSDWSESQFQRLFNKKPVGERIAPAAKKTAADVPSSFSWGGTPGCITPVPD